MIITKTIPIEIYRADLHVLIGPLDDARAWLDREWGDGVGAQIRRPSNAKTFSYEFEDGNFEWCVWFPHSAPSFRTLVHESQHVTLQILRSRGFKLNDSTEEAFAYLVDFVAWKIDQVIDGASSRLRSNRQSGRNPKGDAAEKGQSTPRQGQRRSAKRRARKGVR